jgi:hypothetical protein
MGAMKRCGTGRLGRAVRVALLGALLATGAAHAAADDPRPRSAIRLGLGPVPLEDLALAGALEPIGARSARLDCADASWGRFQKGPAAPVDLAPLDDWVRAYQAAGFDELVVCLGTNAAWSTRDEPGRLRSRSPAPAREHLEAWGRFVAAVVERFDGDGQDDMPGLLGPLRLFEIGGQLPSGGSDGFGPYLSLLERAHRDAHAASHQVVIAHAALWVGAPADDVERARIGLASAETRARLLDHPERFDALNVQLVGDAEALDAALATLRWEMEDRGHRKPILLSGAVSPLVGWGRATDCKADARDAAILLPPATIADRCRLAALLRALARGEAAALAWVREYAALELVRTALVAARHGVFLAQVARVGEPGWFAHPVLGGGAGVAPWMGIRDGGDPVARALSAVAARLRDRSQVESVVSRDGTGRAFLLRGGDRPLWIAWGRSALALPGNSSPTRIVSFPIGEEVVRVAPLLGDAEGRDVRTLGGVAWLELGEAPVVVTPLANP